MSTYIIDSAPDLADVRPEWWSWASCNTGDAQLADVFFPDLGGVPLPHKGSTANERAAYSLAREQMLANEVKAKEICGGCAAVDLCLAAAVTRQEQTGVWGGFNFGRQRKRTEARRYLRMILVADAA